MLLEGPNNAQDTADNRENIWHVLLHLPYQNRYHTKARVNPPHEPGEPMTRRTAQDHADTIGTAPVFDESIHRGVDCAKTDPTIQDEEEPVGGDQRARVGEPSKEQGEAREVPILEYPDGENVWVLGCVPQELQVGHAPFVGSHTLHQALERRPVCIDHIGGEPSNYHISNATVTGAVLLFRYR